MYFINFYFDLFYSLSFFYFFIEKKTYKKEIKSRLMYVDRNKQ